MNRIKIINEIIRSRRAIFPPMYTGETIDDDVIWNILENANWAPTHKHTEPWFFKVIRQESIPQLCAFGARWYKRFTPKENFSEIKLTKILKKPLSASHIVAVCMRRDPHKRVPKWEEQAAVACAVQNMWLTTTASGLGSYWSTPGYALNGEAFFKLKKGEKCLGLFYIGVPKKNLNLSGKRHDIRTKVEWL